MWGQQDSALGEDAAGVRVRRGMGCWRMCAASPAGRAADAREGWWETLWRCRGSRAGTGA